MMSGDLTQLNILPSTDQTLVISQVIFRLKMFRIYNKSFYDCNKECKFVSHWKHIINGIQNFYITTLI